MTDKFLYILYSGMVLLALQACADKNLPDEGGNGVEGKEILFHASMQPSSQTNSVSVITRVGDFVEGGYVEMTSQVWGNWDIHIHHKNLSDLSVEEDEQLYRVASGTQGVLDIEESKKWLWGVSATSSDSHIFQAWTEPNPTGAEAPVVRTDETTGMKTVDFEAGNKAIWEDSKYIGHYLDFLIGTAAGPVDYKTNGLYVPLYFKRLVSRIRIISIVRVYADGTYSKDDIEVTDIEFPNMYRTGILDTHAGERQEDTGAAVFPEVVVTNTIPEQEKGLFVAFEKIYVIYDSTGGLPIYVPPFNFKEAGKFSIGHYGFNVQGGEKTYNTYYGDLGAIFLNREDHKQELRAGESMDIMLELKDDEITGIYVHIDSWNTESDKDVLQRPRPGIYSDGELLVVRDAIINNKDIPENLYEIENDQKVLKIYNDLSVSFSGESSIAIPDGYRLDGMGHNISCSGSLTFTGDVKDLKVNGVPIGVVR